MRVAFFSARGYDIEHFGLANRHLGFTLSFFAQQLNEDTLGMAAGHDAVCVFVNDVVNREVLGELHALGVRTIALRCAGYNNVDVAYAQELGMNVVRVPAYSPHAVAEHAVALLTCMNRHIHRAYSRTRLLNFNLEGLTGVDLHRKTVGVIGAGIIGRIFCKIMSQGFGCKVVVYDPYPNEELKKMGCEFVTLDELYAQSDFISLHCILMDSTYHIINADSLKKMKRGVKIVNAGRGALVDTVAIIDALKEGQVGGLAIDVYEGEGALFFTDRSAEVPTDDVITRLLAFPNVLVTGHQAFLTNEALNSIAEVTLNNINSAAKGEDCPNKVVLQYQ